MLLRDNFFHMPHVLSLLYFTYIVSSFSKKNYSISEKNTQNHRCPLQIILGLPHFTKELGQKLTITSPKEKPKICPYLNSWFESFYWSTRFVKVGLLMDGLKHKWSHKIYICLLRKCNQIRVFFFWGESNQIRSPNMCMRILMIRLD